MKGQVHITDTVKGYSICLLGILYLALIIWSEVHVRHEMLMTLNGVVCDADTVHQFYGFFVKNRAVILCGRFVISGVFVLLGFAVVKRWCRVRGVVGWVVCLVCLLIAEPIGILLFIIQLTRIQRSMGQSERGARQTRRTGDVSRRTGDVSGHMDKPPTPTET